MVGFGALCVHLQPTQRPVGGASPVGVLSADEFAILSAVANRICPPMGPNSPGAVAAGIPEQVAQLISLGPQSLQDQFKLALNALESPLLGLLTGGHARPFTQLDAEGQDAVLRDLRLSSIPQKRTIFMGLRAAISAYYYGSPALWEVTGYSGPPNTKLLRTANSDLLVDYSSLRGGA